ncbi:HNH endonuclease signature motif containing protein [Paenarthrobacter nitroguajacolicus]|uniref:HNH endonuclease signature motif containing protein n=1 Tax=Paenarthrobacter nitroguajacolicus TaxID=211146 RepID=UPI000AFAB469|nr:HNH endonuclease signature motif containing protein [Paenarthrobacter nitroguajacolicus]
MGAIGQVVARRAGSPRADALLRQRSLSVPVRTAALRGSTAADTLAGSSRGAGLLPGLESLSGLPEFSTGDGVKSLDAAPGLPLVLAADIKRRESLIEGGRPSPGAVGEPLEQASEALGLLRESVVDEARLFGFVEAADFAGRVEEISRSLEYLQVVAAQAVERTRKEAQQASPGASGWRTGWTEPEPASETPASSVNAAMSSEVCSFPDAATAAGVSTVSPLDDGYRNAAEFLRARLRISIGEARRRLALAADVVPQTGMAGQQIPARREVLADALASALVPSRSATIISTALDQVRQLTDEDTITRMEHALTTTAMESDPDFVARMTKRWTDRIDQDGAEPSEEVLRQLQGAFLRRRRRHGLHHLEIFATAEQYETLTTAMNTATNPRLTTGSKPSGPDLDRRSRAQKLLNGLVGACALAMTTGKLPSNGGLRPQLTVTIDHRDLFEQVNDHQRLSTGPAGNRLSTGTATFTGPIHPNTIRKIACDADIIPVLLGTDSRVLDIGRTTRIFPPHIRKAITARDCGCAFPDCTIPAPWCEAHHTTYWSYGGTTSTNNGTLLCSHHHHLIHKEQWRIDITTGVPWFIPPPHLDPQQTPRRNHHHTPQRT